MSDNEQHAERELEKERKLAAIEAKRVEAAELRAKREKRERERAEREREQREAAAARAAAECAKQWATLMSTLSVAVVDSINEYNDGDPPEEIPFQLKPSSSARAGKKRLLGTKESQIALRSAPREATPRSNAPDPCARVSHAHQRRPPERHPSDQRARAERRSPQHNMRAHRPVPNTAHAHMLLPHAHRPDEPARLEAPQRPHRRAAARAAHPPSARLPQN